MRVSVDDPNSWPSSVRDGCGELARRASPNPRYIEDLHLSGDDEDEFRSLFAGCRIVAYHATRLLPHEVEDVSVGGLRRLTPELVLHRIQKAHDCGHITEEERAAFSDAHVFATGEARNRKDQICFFLSETTLTDRVYGIHPLMREWGGEAISMSSRGVAFSPRLRELGLPAIVVATLDLDQGWRVHSVWPGMQEVFVSRWVGLDDIDADVYYRGDVPGEYIEAVWCPGEPAYERFLDLPQN